MQCDPCIPCSSSCLDSDNDISGAYSSLPNLLNLHITQHGIVLFSLAIASPLFVKPCRETNPDNVSVNVLAYVLFKRRNQFTEVSHVSRSGKLWPRIRNVCFVQTNMVSIEPLQPARRVLMGSVVWIPQMAARTQADSVAQFVPCCVMLTRNQVMWIGSPSTANRACVVPIS